MQLGIVFCHHSGCVRVWILGGAKYCRNDINARILISGGAKLCKITWILKFQGGKCPLAPPVTQPLHSYVQYLDSHVTYGCSLLQMAQGSGWRPTNWCSLPFFDRRGQFQLAFYVSFPIFGSGRKSCHLQERIHVFLGRNDFKSSRETYSPGNFNSYTGALLRFYRGCHMFWATQKLI